MQKCKRGGTFLAEAILTPAGSVLRIPPFCMRRSVVEPEQRHSAVLYHVFLPLGPGDPLVAGALPPVRLDEVLEGDGLRLDEPLLEIRMDHAGRLGGAVAAVDGP